MPGGRYILQVLQYLIFVEFSGSGCTLGSIGPSTELKPVIFPVEWKISFLQMVSISSFSEFEDLGIIPGSVNADNAMNAMTVT